MKKIKIFNNKIYKCSHASGVPEEGGGRWVDSPPWNLLLVMF